MANTPAGWDATTYQNFKTANPTLEPTAQDTAKMLGGSLVAQNGVQGVQRGNQWTNLAYATPTTPTAITASSLTPQTPMNLAPTPVNTTASGVIAEGVSSAEQNQQYLNLQNAEKSSWDATTNLMTQIGGKTAEGLQLQESTGLNAKTQESNKNELAILDTQKAGQAEKDALRKIPGITAYAIQLKDAEIDKKNAEKITDLRMKNAYLAVDIAGVQKQIDTALALKYEPLQTALDINKLNFENIRDKVSKAEERQWTLQHEDRQAKLDADKEDKKNKLALIPKAMENGITLPSDIVSYLTNPNTTYAQGLQKMGERGISLAKPIVAKTTGGGSGTSGEKATFTSTQLNKGVATSGLGLENFKAQPYEVQNFYINKPTQAKTFNEVIKGISDGTENPTSLKEEITNDPTIPQDVKDHMISRIDSVKVQGSTVGNWFKNVWNYITS